MAELGLQGILLLLISLMKCLEGTKVLADFKKCGDLECESLISRVLAMRDFRGPDCRYLNFTKGEEISVFAKLAGEREDLWAGSKGKDFGYFPRDAVQIEEVFISEEVEISTKESDFLCLLGESYAFENEDSELNSDNDENINLYEEDKDQISSVYASDFQIESEFYSTSESTLFEDLFSASGAPEEVKSTSESKDWGGVEAEIVEQDPFPEVDNVSPLSAVPEVKGWFGIGREQTEEQTFESVTESLYENSFQSRKIAVEDDNYLENDGEPQTENKLKAEPDSHSMPQKEPEQVSESEHIHKTQATGWFGGGFTSYLGFGKEDTELELSSQESDLPLEDVPNSVSFDEEPTDPRTEILIEKEDTITSGNSTLLPSWFDFGFGMLSSAYANEDKIKSDDEKNGDKHGHPPINESDLDKEQEIKRRKMTETEDQAGKESGLEKIDNSDTLPYFQKFLYNFDNPWNFQNIPKETDLPISEHILNENNIAENDEKELFSDENFSTDDKKIMSSKSRYSRSVNSFPSEVTMTTKDLKNDLPRKQKGNTANKVFKKEKKNYSFADLVSEIESLNEIHEELHFKNPSKNHGEKSKTSLYTEEPTQGEIDRSEENIFQNDQIFSSDYSLFAQKEDSSAYQILENLFRIVYDFMSSAFLLIVILTEKVVATLPEDMRPGPNPYGFTWELVICATFVGLFAAFLFLWRSFRSVRSRFYMGREKKLAVELSTLIEEKCKLLEKLSLVQKEYESLESSVKDSGFEKESTEAQNLEAVYEKLNNSKSKVEDEILSLEKELEEEKSKHSEQDKLVADTSQTKQSLEDELKSLKSQVAEAKTTLKIFQMNEERLKVAIKDAMSENSELQEIEKQFLQEAEEWKEQVSELDKQKIAFEVSKLDVEQVLNDKENQIKSLTEHLLKMEDWATVLGEDITDDSLELEMSDSENDNHLKGPLKKLIHAAKLNASLKALEGERDQIYTQLAEIDKTKEDLTACIKKIQAEQASLRSENAQFENEIQKLQQKLKVITELYHENEMTLHRKLTVEENYRLEKEEKLSKADEKISYATEELETYRKRAKDLEEELERTTQSYQGQILSHEKKAHDNWLAARTAERNLNELRKENAYNRQKLTETEFKFELLEKDPYALDVPNTAFGREHSPYGPSPLGRPSSETRAFLSPPPLLEGPYRLSPLSPGGGGRGSRGPGNPLDHQIPNERGDSNSDRLTDPHRAPSDTGSLSPPWEQDRRMMMPPSGQPYPDSVLPSQRQDRFYTNSGRLSESAELRSFNMPSLDRVDGPMEMESTRIDSKEDLSNLNISESSLPAENEATGPGFVPPAIPLVRGPLFPRGPFTRRGPPFPPPPPGSMYGTPRDYFPPRDFPGPPPPFAMRNVYSPRSLPHYLPRAGFLPSPPPPESRSEFSSGVILPSNEPTTENTEPQQET